MSLANRKHTRKSKFTKVEKQRSAFDREKLAEKRRLNKQRRRTRQKKKKILKEGLKIKKTEAKRNKTIHRKLKREKQNMTHFSEKSTAWLSLDRINSIARSTGFIKNSRGKITPIAFLLTLSYGMFANGSSTLVILALNMFTWFNISITAQALCGRISSIATVNFLKEILAGALANQLKYGFQNQYAVLLQWFSSVLLEDSTQFMLKESVAKELKGSGGSASKSSMKLNMLYDITKHTVSGCDIVAGSVSDQALSKNVLKRLGKFALLIRDLGYFNIFDMISIQKMKAFFLSRLKIGVLIFKNQDDKNPIPINVFLENATKNGNSIDENVYIGKERFPVRIIGEKVPDFVKEKRKNSYTKNKIKRDKKKQMSENYLSWIGYSIFVTNIPSEMMDCANVIINIYRIRWQIELFFKRIKSILEIHIIKGETENRVNCLVYSKLISLLMAQSMISYAASICEDDEEISEYKVMVWLQGNNRLGRAIIEFGSLDSLLDELIRSNYLLCKNKRKKSKSTFRVIEESLMNNNFTWIASENIA
jgi:Transposase DDE domain